MAPSFGRLIEGSIVGGYRIDREIAAGGMGVVYEATHAVLSRRVALKVMHGGLVADGASTGRLLQEARILEALAHPGVVEVHGCGVLDDGRPWLAMDLIAGVTLTEHAERRGALACDEVIALVRDVADVLAAAHDVGVVHRDLKPDNILMVGGDGFPLRVVDWGIARWASAPAHLTLADTILGTPMYMAPEQACGKSLDGRCDVYSLGVIAYELLAGRPPFEGNTPVEVLVQKVTTCPPSLAALCPTIPREIVSLVERMLQVDPALRPTAGRIRDEATRLSRTPRRPPRASRTVEMPLEAAIASLLAEQAPQVEAAVIPSPRPARVRWTPVPALVSSETRVASDAELAAIHAMLG
jgi:serine/threonine-protein kinase